MKRRLLNLFTGSLRRLPILTPLLLLLFIATLIAWLRSHITADNISWSRGQREPEHEESRSLQFTSSRGTVRVTYNAVENDGPAPFFQEMAQRRPRQRPPIWSRFSWRTDPAAGSAPNESTTLGFRWYRDTHRSTIPHDAGPVRIWQQHASLTFPYWFLSLLALLPLIPRLPRLWRTIYYHPRRPMLQDLIIVYAPLLVVATSSIAVVVANYRVSQNPKVTIPTVTLLLALTGWWSLRRSDAMKQHRQTHARPLPLPRCIHCGYDLRATPTQCPECGHAPTPT